MKQNAVSNLQFRADINFVGESSACFKSISFPPIDDFVMSIDKEGNTVSNYGDDVWDFRTFGAKKMMSFSEYDEINKSFFKKVMFYLIYSNLFPGKYDSLKSHYQNLSKIFKQCSKQKIGADELRRFPNVIEEIAISIAPSLFQPSIWLFDRLLKNKVQLGFVLYDEKSIVHHSKFNPNHEMGQNAYIPPKIWTTMIVRLDEILNDFIQHRDNLEKAFNYLSTSIIENEKRKKSKGAATSPFALSTSNYMIRYGANFKTFAKDYGIIDWVNKYAVEVSSGGFTFQKFLSTLNNTVFACYLYLLFYSIMRKSEALSLRVDCLNYEEDEKLGKIPILVGETTKTDPDSDARWIVNKRAEKAVEVARTLVEWKMQHAQSKSSKEPPFLFQRVDIWIKKAQSSKPRGFADANTLIFMAPKFFKSDSYVITQEDYQIALSMTPSLEKEAWFSVGGVWKFGYHQFRRTLAVMFALNNVSAATGQFQMKHGTREQQFHYMNNYTKLRFNGLASELVINEFYSEMARNIIDVVEGAGNKVLPHKKSPVANDVISFITESETKQLMAAAKNGKVGFRKNLLGGCMKQGSCEYGGVDSISHCAGGHGGNMCSDLIIDGSKESEFIEDREYLREEMDDLPDDTPRYGALKSEVRGYDNILGIIETKKKES